MFKRLLRPGSPSTLIESSFQEFSTMLRQSAQMLDLALAALLDNQPLEADLEDMDDIVDEGERRVRRSVLEHLAVNPEQDLVASLVLASMVQDAERMGDFARGLAELVPLAKSPRQGPFAERLRQIAADLRPLFKVCERAFQEDDVEEARQVVSKCRNLKKEIMALTRDIAASDLTADMAVVYAGTARILRRISAHISNVCSSVVQPYDRIRHGDEDV